MGCQGSDLGSVLFSIYRSDTPTNEYTTTGTLLDDTMIKATPENPEVISLNLLDHLFEIKLWFQKLNIKLNKNKSQRIMSTIGKQNCSPVYITTCFE